MHIITHAGRAIIACHGEITCVELKKLKTLSNILLELPEAEIANLIKLGELCEVCQND